VILLKFYGGHALEQVAQRLWGLHSQRYSKSDWTWPSATCSSSPCQPQPSCDPATLKKFKSHSTNWVCYLTFLLTLCTVLK